METGICGVRNADGMAIPNCGGEQCLPGHTYGPAIRDHFLIHFVASGCGTLRAADREYKIGAGQGFIIFPDEITVYSADMAQPWAYDWVGYRGRGQANLPRKLGSAGKTVFFSPKILRRSADLCGT